MDYFYGEIKDVADRITREVEYLSKSIHPSMLMFARYLQRTFPQDIMTAVSEVFHDIEWYEDGDCGIEDVDKSVNKLLTLSKDDFVRRSVENTLRKKEDGIYREILAMLNANRLFFKCGRCKEYFLPYITEMNEATTLSTNCNKCESELHEKARQG